MSHKLPIVYSCEYSCESCPYPDCTLTLYENKKEYQELYRNKFHKQILGQKAEYRAKNRNYLKNSEKLRNYKNKGHRLEDVVFVKAMPSEKYTEYDMIGTHGILCFFLINKKPYFTYITTDMWKSFRKKITEILEDSDKRIVIKTETLVFYFNHEYNK